MAWISLMLLLALSTATYAAVPILREGYMNCSIYLDTGMRMGCEGVNHLHDTKSYVRDTSKNLEKLRKGLKQLDSKTLVPLQHDESALTNELKSLDKDTSAVVQQITAVQPNVTAVQTGMGKLYESVAGILKKVLAVQASVSAVEKDAGALKKVADGVQGEVTAVKKETPVVRKDVGQVHTDVGKVQKIVDALQKTLKAVAADVAVTRKECTMHPAPPSPPPPVKTMTVSGKHFVYLACEECPPGFELQTATKSCYQVVSTKRTWALAGIHCQSLHPSAHLVVINDEAEQKVVEDLIKKLDADPKKRCATYWTAGQRFDPHAKTPFIWRLLNTYRGLEERREVTFEHWAPGQPQYSKNLEACIEVNEKRQYQWDDWSCDQPVCSICEVELSG